MELYTYFPDMPSRFRKGTTLPFLPSPVRYVLYHISKRKINKYNLFPVHAGNIWAIKFLINQQDAQITVNELYFPLDVLHVSDYVSPSSGATFISCTSHLVYASICRYVWLLCDYSYTTARRMVPAYTKCDVQLIKCCSWWWTNIIRNM